MKSNIGTDAAKLAGLQVDLLTKIRAGKITLESLEKFVRGELVDAGSDSTLDTKNIWGEALQKAYNLLGLNKDYEVFRKEHPYSDKEGYWVIDMLKGLSCKGVIDALRKLKVAVNASDTLDQDVVENQRDPSKGSYTVAFKATVEADEENKNQSANQRKELYCQDITLLERLFLELEQNCQDITLLERLFLELVYFLTTGEHLDTKNYTLCTGSRGRDGGVPSVCFGAGDRAVFVDWFRPGSRFGRFRARSVVPVN